MNLFDPVICWILLVWFVLLGACIGSFLNVVVYRLPLGKSLSDPPSHCPKCKHRIRWYDNVPVFGWLMLGGKCRDCREPISVRYPAVEAICAVVFGSIAFMLLRREGDASIQEFFCLALALSTLVVTLLAAGLIELDGQKVPWKLFIPAVLMGPMVPWLAVESFHIRIYSLGLELPKPVDLVEINRLFFSLFFCFGWSLPFCGLPRPGRKLAWIVSAVLIGLYLGIGGIVIIVLSSFILLVIFRTPFQDILPTHLLLFIIVFMICLASASPS